MSMHTGSIGTSLNWPASLNCFHPVAYVACTHGPGLGGSDLFLNCGLE